MDLYAKDILASIAVHTVNIVVDQDFKLEGLAHGTYVAHLPVVFDHLCHVCPTCHLGTIYHGADVDLVCHKFFAEIFGPATREKRVHGLELVTQKLPFCAERIVGDLLESLDAVIVEDLGSFGILLETRDLDQL